MLDIFLETVAERTKVAEANGRLMKQLERLPMSALQKIASGGLPDMKIAEDQGCWLEKFRGSPLFEEAIGIEKEELEVQTSEMERRRAQIAMDANVPRWDETDLKRQELSIRRKMLELELAGADMSDPGDADFEDEDPGADAPPDLEAAEHAAAPPVAKAEGAPPPPPHAAPPPPAAAAGADAGPPGPPAHHAPPPPPHAAAEEGSDEGSDGPPPPHDDAKGPPAAAKEEGDDKPKPKPPTTKVTKETVEKPAEDKIDIKAASARMRFALAVKEAQPAVRASAFRR